MSAVWQKLLHGLKNFVLEFRENGLIGLLWPLPENRFWLGSVHFAAMAIARATIEFPVVRANYRSGL